MLWRKHLEKLPNDVSERIIDHIFENNKNILRFYITNTLECDLFHKRIEMIRNKIIRKYNLHSWKDCQNYLPAFKDYMKSVYFI
tara:strand:+ start:483 stop:734 length:252 start_codon:yes stop_codon:yes gene_type:complete